MNKNLLIYFITIFSNTLGQFPNVKPLINAHAHNDYEHERPLIDALDNGFCSVEADLFDEGSKFLVAHDIEDTSPMKTLRSMYLDPLKQIIEDNNGSVYPQGPTFKLLLDVKINQYDNFLLLNQILSEYKEILSYTDESGVYHHGPVIAMVSGTNRPVELIRNTLPRYTGLDGRVVDGDLNSSDPFAILPMVSQNWSSNYQDQLESMAFSAGEKDRHLRFWNTPDDESLWSKFLMAGGNILINTDNLTKLSQYLNVNNPSYPQLVTNNKLTVQEGASSIITANDLSVSDSDTKPSDLLFIIRITPKSGQVENINEPGVPISYFTQMDINNGEIKYANLTLDLEGDRFGFTIQDGFNEIINQWFEIGMNATSVFHDFKKNIFTNNKLFSGNLNDFNLNQKIMIHDVRGKKIDLLPKKNPIKIKIIY